MPERSWGKLVDEGRALLESEERGTSSFAWGWGDLALEVEPMTADPHGGPTGAHARLRQWAEEIGWFESERGLETLLKYRQVAAAWPKGKRVDGVSWAVHRILVARQDAIRPGMSRRDAIKIAGWKPREREEAVSPVQSVRTALADPAVAREVMADPQVRHVVDEARPPEDREEQARRLVRDPQIAEAIHRDPKAAPMLRRASAKVAKENEVAARERQRERVPELVNRSVIYEIAGMLGHARRDVNAALDRLREIELDDDYREMLKEEANDVQTSLGWLVSFLESGDRSFEAALNRLLEEG